jgi:hypothetical protein
MKALVSPNELAVFGGGSAKRIAQVSQDSEVFEVAPPLFWVSCPDDCVADLWFFNEETGSCEHIPEPSAPETPVEVLP